MSCVEFGGSVNNDPTNAGLFSADIEHAMRQNAIISGTKRPTVKRISKTVAWAIAKYEHPLTIMPPDVQVKVEKLVLEVKTASSMKQKNRLTMANMTLAGCNLTINISRSSSNNNNTAANAKSSVARGKRGFSILTGALVQFRLVASQLSVALSLPASQNMLPPAQRQSGKEQAETLKSGLPAYPSSVVDSANPLDGGHMLILKRSGSTSSISDNSDNSGNNTVAVNAQSSARPTVATGPAKPVRAHATADANSNVAAGGSGMKGPYNINTPVDNLPTTSNTTASTSNKTELREIISSSPGETFFIFCIILDLDDKGEGAGDVQLAFGGIRMDLSKRILAAMIQPEFASIFGNIIKYYSEISEIMPLMNDSSSVMIDWHEKLPFIVLACDPPTSILERMSKNAQKKLLRPPSVFQKSPSKPTAAAAVEKDLQSVMINDTGATVTITQEGAGEDHSSAGNDDDVDDEEHEAHAHGEGEDIITPMLDESCVYADNDSDQANEEQLHQQQAEEEETEEETLEHRKSRRQAMIFNRNLMQWLGTLEAALPRVLSLCLRTSPIVLQTLEASLLRDLVYTKIHSILDKAANRDVAGGRFGAASSLFSTDSLFGLLSHLILATSDAGVAGGTRPRGYTTFTGVRYYTFLCFFS